MQITQIRIAGFKSFVDPTDVPVEEGLTGIVGPNGCGKSNLLEALRWAMGASSARAMRGSEMDDLIFSGSEARPARETAEVTLVIDNSDRKAPAEFNASDTLEIQRRLKRGIGSTYKLNGRTVRGKDIQLLFADASTGANSPALVRQGQISELIGSKPQNRRRILEEAAGIAGLNTRRHEAELKLRAAETNLERLTELSAESERQLESLKRQARTARKYRALSDEIAGLDALAAHLRWAEAKTARQTAANALALAKTSVEALTREDAISETARLNASGRLAPLREAESAASAKLGQTRIALARLETEQKAATDAIGRIEGELSRLLGDLEREEQAIAEANEAKAHAQTELDKLPENDDSQTGAQEAEIRAALESARQTLQAEQTRTDAASTRLAEARARHQASRETARLQTQREATLRLEAEKLRKDLDGKDSATHLNAALMEAEALESAAEQELITCEQALKNADLSLQRAQEAERTSGEPVSELDKALRALEGEIAGLERLLRKLETSKAPPVLERVHTRQGYERAVAAALGDDLQASTDRTSSLYWAGAKAHTLALPQDIKPLSSLTDAPEELAARLSQCGLVDAGDGARLALLLLPGQRLVSKEGHLWRWDGFVRTPEAPVSAAEHLEQKARLKTAREELLPLKVQSEAAKEKLETAKADRAACEAILRDVRAQTPRAATALNEARRETARARQGADHAAMKREATQTTLTRVEADLRNAVEALSFLQGREGEGDVVRLEAELAAARETLAKARETEIEARGQLTDLTRGREQALARRNGLKRDLDACQRRAEAAITRRDSLLSRCEETRLNLESARSGAAGKTNTAISDLRDVVEALEAARKAAADSLANAEAEARTAEQTARTSNQAAAKAREALAAASVMLDAAEARFTEVVEIARNQFQRLPEGLLPLAQSKLEEDVILSATYAQTAQKADFRKRDRDQLGGVNMDAEAEAEELGERLSVQGNEKKDLTKAIAKLREGVDSLNTEGRDRLLQAFETVNTHFKALFTALFRGGQAELRLIDADDPLAAGLEIFAQPPGKRLGTLQLMSGGEQALTAAALIFAVFLSNPAPVCVLDEVDAPLDDANVDRFCRMLDEMRTRTHTRFIVITHNPVTMSRMDRLFGVTMREKGVSKLVSVDLNAAEELVAAE